MHRNYQLLWRQLVHPLNGGSKRVKLMIMVATMIFSGQAGALTTNLLVSFEGVLEGTNYTLGAGEIDVSGTFRATGVPLIEAGRAVLYDNEDSDVIAAGFRFDPSGIGSLAVTNWVAEAVVVFDSFRANPSPVIDVQGDADFGVSSNGCLLEAGYWDGEKKCLMQAALPEVRSFVHLALVWEADLSRLTAYTNGVPIGSESVRPFVAAGSVSFGCRARERGGARGIDGDLLAVSFATSGDPIRPVDFLISEPPPPPVQVDPRFPSDQVAPESGARWLPIRIRQLEMERSELLEKLSVLPQHQPVFLSDQLGYHSQIVNVNDSEVLTPHWIQFGWEWGPRLDSIALVPAVNPKESGAYAFPKRFKIEMRPTETNEFETVVDWMEEDFPDPGLYPVFFSGIDRLVRHVRITVQPRACEGDTAYFAMGEIYMLQQRLDGSTGGDMAAWGTGHVMVETSDSLFIPPLWDLDYVHDGLTGFGFPLSDEMVEAPDLMVVFEDGKAPDAVQLVLDLGRVQPIGVIDFWPAEPPVGLAFLSFGFPGEIVVELSATPGFAEAEVLRADSGGKMQRENPLSMPARAYRARYLRVTMREFGEYQGRRILGMGEIRVTEFDEVLSEGCTITATGIPEHDMDQLPLLVDGYSRHRRIVPVGEWVKGLAQRRPLDRRLAVLDPEIKHARLEWARIKQRTGRWSGGFVVLGLVGGLVFQRQMRKRGLDKLKWRIARDLHDDVGSNLGSITLVAEKLKHVAVDTESMENLRDLSLLAREACASLREVVWVIDEKRIRLPQLIQRLGERAERVMGGVELFINTSEDCPNCVVSLTFKRHLIMFFKEVLHNCARHAEATQVWINFSMGDQCFKISVRDNGCGFDPSEASDGWGLSSMKERAEEMGCEMKLTSRIGTGTTIVLEIPLAVLPGELSKAYKTSN